MLATWDAERPETGGRMMTTESRQCRFSGELHSDTVERDRSYPNFVPERAAAKSAS
jgi:hypothetical protein